MKVPRVGNIVKYEPRKKRPTKEDFKPRYDPNRPPDNIA